MRDPSSYACSRRKITHKYFGEQKSQSEGRALPLKECTLALKYREKKLIKFIRATNGHFAKQYAGERRDP